MYEPRLESAESADLLTPLLAADHEERGSQMGQSKIDR